MMHKLEAANHKIPKHAPAKAPLSQDAPVESNSFLSLGNQAILQRETMSPRVRKELPSTVRKGGASAVAAVPS